MHATLQPDKKWLLLHRNELFDHKTGCTRILKQVATAIIYYLYHNKYLR